MSHHHYVVNELFSNADGTIQYIEMKIGQFGGENDWSGHSIRVFNSDGSSSHAYGFSRDLPSASTANTTVLLATQGFADLGLVTPDYIIPDNFLYITGGRVVYASINTLVYNTLPTDGLHSVNTADLIVLEGTPTNFAGETAVINIPSYNPIAGTAAAETITGTSEPDRIDAGAGNDRLIGGGGNDLLNGEAGIDTAVYTANRNAYSVGIGGSSVGGAIEGTDILSGVERIQFADRNLAFDFGDGAAARTAKLLGAVFGPDDVDNETYAGIGLSLFDSGMSYQAVADLAIHAALGATVDNAALVRLLYTNLTGQSASDAEVASYVAMITAGTFTQATLTTFAADHGLNTQRIDLAGLAQEGLEYLPAA